MGGLARSPGAQKFQDSLPFLSKAPPDLLCLLEGMEFRQYPGRSEACSPVSEVGTRVPLF